MGMIEELNLLEGPTVSQLIFYGIQAFRELSGYYLEEFKILMVHSKAGYWDRHCCYACHLNRQIMKVKHANT